MAYFLRHPQGRFYSREVAEQTGLSRAGTNFSLRDLADAKLLNLEKKGRMHFYSLAARSPLVRQIKIVLVITELAPLIDELKKDAIRIVLYGSSARGEDVEESDIDLFILTRDRNAMEKCLTKTMIDKRIQPVIHTPQEWAKIEMKNSVFSDQVEQGIVLWDANES